MQLFILLLLLSLILKHPPDLLNETVIIVFN